MEKIGTIILTVLLSALFNIIYGVVVMWLWNILMPNIFGLTTITFAQGVGLVILCDILFTPKFNFDNNTD